jgi:hypothetical protein
MRAVDLLLGNIPEMDKERQKKNKKRKYIKEWAEKNAAKIRKRQREIKREKYHNDPEYRAKSIQRSKEYRERNRGQVTDRERDRRKAKIVKMTEEEYAAYREKNNARQRRYYLAKKMKLTANTKEQGDGAGEKYSSSTTHEKP